MDSSASTDPTDRSTPAEGSAPVFSYDGSGRDALGIVFLNAVLTLLTLGLYRFFGKTRYRRFLWNHTAVDGDRFEYLGTWDELLIGLLVVAVVFIPIIVALTLLLDVLYFTHPAADFREAAIRYAEIQVGGFVVLFALGQAALYRARRYRLSRTAWRGIRAGQDGSALTYGILWVALTLGTIVTAGLALPLRNRYLFAYRLNHTWLGNQRFVFAASGRRLFRLWTDWMLSWILLVGAVVVGVFLTPSPIVVLLFALASGLAYVGYRASEIRYLASHASVAGLRFEVDLGLWRLLRMYFLPALISMLVVLGLFAATRSWSFFEGPFARDSDVPTWIGPLLFAILSLFVWGVFQQVLFHRYMRVFGEKLRITGAYAPAELRPNPIPRSRFGEGLADALDAGGL